jgi:hypothetical protein
MKTQTTCLPREWSGQGYWRERKTAILYCLLEGPKRFNELQRLVGNLHRRLNTV